MALAELAMSAYDTRRDVPAAEWDLMTDGGSTYLSHGWLGVREAELPAGAVARHVLVRADGAAIRKASLYLFRRPPHPLYSPYSTLGAAERATHEPVVFAAGWSEFRGEIPSAPGTSGEDRRAALGRIAAEATALATDVQPGPTTRYGEQCAAGGGP